MLLENELQQSIYADLKADPTLTALIVDVYDAVPQGAVSQDDSAFPFVTIGAIDSLDWSTDTSSGSETFIDIACYSRYSGTKEIKDIQQAVYNVLHRSANLSVASGNLVTIDFDRTNKPILDPDGKTRNGVVSFRVIIDD